jgi:hypothetical protein
MGWPVVSFKDNPMPKIHAPNYTQVPNVVLDNIQDLTEAETKIMMVICRQTFGWQRSKARLSRNDFMIHTGLSHQSVKNGIDKLLERGWLLRGETSNTFNYSINLENVEPPQNLAPLNAVDPLKYSPLTSQILAPLDAEKGLKFSPHKRNSLKREETKVSRGKRESSSESTLHQTLIDDWTTAYRITFDRAYAFQGGRDGKAAKSLLSIAKEPGAVMQVATRAWGEMDKPGRFWCKNAATLSGLASRWNEIQNELDAPASTPAAAFQRTNGHGENPTAKRIALERELQRIDGRLDALNDALRYREDVDTKPKLVAERTELKRKREAVAAALEAVNQTLLSA